MRGRGGRDGGMEGWREGGREGGREGRKEGGRVPLCMAMRRNVVFDRWRI